LDIIKIHEALENFKKENYDFDVYASTLFWWNKKTVPEDKNIEFNNCVGLVLMLLKAGGIGSDFTLWKSFLRSGLPCGVLGGAAGAMVGSLCGGGEDLSSSTDPTGGTGTFASEKMFHTSSSDYSKFSIPNKSSLFSPNSRGHVPSNYIRRPVSNTLEPSSIFSGDRVFTVVGIYVTSMTAAAVGGGIGFKVKSTAFGALFGALLGCAIGTVYDYSQLPDLIAVTPQDLNELLMQVKDVRDGRTLSLAANQLQRLLNLQTPGTVEDDTGNEKSRPTIIN
jgi:hypothetical protein